jgi:lipopolysaccharide export system permease protein
MQAIWVGFDEISGKGIDLKFILKFIGYLALTVVPMAMPIGILLSSIMSLGNLAENYEFAAVKSAGISLRRFIMPVMMVTLFLSGVNFLFLNYVYPDATLKQKNMFLNMKKKQPALALIPGTFNDDIPGFSIKFDEKYGEEQNLLKSVQIYDFTKKNGKTTVITAKNGEISSEEGSRYMKFILTDGNYYEDHTTRRDNKNKRDRMPFSRSTFEKYSINIDISSFSNSTLEDTVFSKQHQMLSLKQLVIESDTSKIGYDKSIAARARNLSILLRTSKLVPFPDSTKVLQLSDTILSNFELDDQSTIIQNAIESVKNNIRTFSKSKVDLFKRRRKALNLYDHEYHNRIAFSFACLVLFFIGAPLGSIIRKGGMGLPMVLAIVIFVIYFFISSFGRNLAEESAISAWLGGWLATFILLPFGIFLTRRAAKDKGIFNLNSIIDSIKNLFNRFNFKKKL